MLTPIPFAFGELSLGLLCSGHVELIFTGWLESYCRDKIVRKREELGDDFNLHLRIWQQKCDCEEYEWTGYTSLCVRASEAGRKKLLHLMMQAASAALPGASPVTPALVDQIFADPDKCVELFNDEVGEGRPPLGLYWKALQEGRPTAPAKR